MSNCDILNTEKRYLRHGGRFAPAREVMHMNTAEIIALMALIVNVVYVTYIITKKK